MGKQMFRNIISFLKSLFMTKREDPIVPEEKPNHFLKSPHELILEIAKGEIGQKEFRDSENGRILQYHDCTTLDASKDEVPWCSSFCNWVLLQFWMKYLPKTLAQFSYRIPKNVVIGIVSSNYLKNDKNYYPDDIYFGLRSLPTFSAAAKSWEKWGYELENPVAGCIVVLTRPPDRDINRHVAIYVEDANNKDFIYCLGGNQSDGVNIKPFNKSNVICYRGIFPEDTKWKN